MSPPELEAGTSSEPVSMPELSGAGGAAGAGTESEPVRRPGHGFYGTLKSEAGEPLATTAVMGCMATTCYFGETDASGNFEFSIEPPAEVAFKTHEDLTSEPRRAAALHPVLLVDDFLVSLGNVHVPNLDNGALFGPIENDPQALSAGDGLNLIVWRSSLKPSLGDTLVDLSARRIPPEQQPVLPEVDPADVVAMYALHPFGARSAKPIAVQAESTLPHGTRVSFQTISELDGLLSPKVPGSSDGTYVTTDAGAGINKLTWLVISLED